MLSPCQPVLTHSLMINVQPTFKPLLHVGLPDPPAMAEHKGLNTSMTTQRGDTLLREFCGINVAMQIPIRYL